MTKRHSSVHFSHDHHHESTTFDDRALNGLGVLADVVRSENFAIVGKALNMSQSGVHRATVRLEASWRTSADYPRTVTWSEEGRRLYEQIVSSPRYSRFS
jgi:hypothetical protein